ncbi:MAG: hypothetical protein AB7F86_03950 [Bdellovibrionales bacterium]
MKFLDLERMHPVERRQFLKFVSAFIALPIVSPRTREAIAEVILGSPAHAQAAPMNFLEVCFRDQWDFQCLFVPPGVAQSYANAQNRLPPAGAPIQERLNFYVTPNAAELRPHLDDIAVMEVGEVCVGNVHAHEAANPLRSPGRSYDRTAGKIDMSTVDKRPGGRSDGNEVYYSSTPTPAILHNYYSKSQTPNLTNGVILRSTLRGDIHTYYHFEGNLTNAQADRFFDKATFLNRFANTNIPPATSSSQKHGALIAQFVKRLDDSYLQRVLAQAERTKQAARADAMGGLLAGSTPAPISLALSPTEEQMWKNGVTEQVICGGDDANQCVVQGNKWHPSELFAYAGKLFQSGQVRTVAIDFDLSDVHTNRTKFMMDTQAQQSGKTLARLINFLKANNLWANTVIAMYTLDGSRSMETNSTGQDSKNAVVLAGGKIRGGYYGDIRFTNNNFVYHRPDDNGNPVAGGTTGGGMRVPAADVYKTVMTAAGIPMSVLDGFADVKPGKILNYMLR